jgi:hypothetical protein
MLATSPCASGELSNKRMPPRREHRRAVGSSRVRAKTGRRPARLWFFIAVLLMAAAVAPRVARADDDDDDDEAPPPRITATSKEDGDDSPIESATAAPPDKGRPGSGPGVDFTLDAAYGQGIIQDRPLFPVEAFPFFMMDSGMLFSDLRFYPTIDGTFGGSLGGGYRYYSHDLDRVFGISGWYDGDGTRGEYFQQLGLSLETYGKWWDFRTNLYLPVGQTYQLESQGVVPGATHFVGDNVAFSEISTYLAAMRGLDMEVGVPFPGDFAHDHALRFFAGWYFYNDDQGDNIVGGSARIQANIFSGLDAATELTYDDYFHARAYVNVSWTFGPLHGSNLEQDNAQGRLGERVVRNYTVLVTEQSQVDAGVLAVDPDTGTPYVIAQVNSAAATSGDGSIQHPFQTIAAAQATGADIVFVEAGSVFHGANATVVMNNGQSLIGDGTGVQNSIPVSQVGTLLLPHGPTTGALPVIDSSTGTAVTLANDVTLSGFTITNSAGPGIVANGVGGFAIRNVAVEHSGADGIDIVNPTTAINLQNVSVTNSVGNGLLINGGGDQITYSGTLAGNQGYDLVIENTTAGTAYMGNALFPGSGSQGILLQNDAGNVNFNSLTVQNTVGSGISIQGGSGTFTFNGLTTVTGAAGPSIVVEGLQAAVVNNSGDVTKSAGSAVFGGITINDRESEGLVLNNNSGPVTINGTTTIPNQESATASAISIQNSTGTVSFNNPVKVTDATGNAAVSMSNDSGTISFGTLNITSSGGTGLYADNLGILNIASSTTPAGTIVSTGGTAVDLENVNDMNVNFVSVSSSGAVAGLKLLNDGGTFGVYANGTGNTGSGGTIETAGTGILLDSVSAVGLESINLVGNGVGISAQNVGTLGITNFQITNSSSYGIQSLDTKSLTVTNTLFENNGGPNIQAQYDQANAYGIAIATSKFLSSTSDNIQITGLPGAAGGTISLTAENNTFTNAEFGTMGINLNWNGTVAATVNQNTFTVGGGTNTGVYINNTSTAALTTISYTNNTFTSEGGTDTGLHILAAGPSALDISANTMNFAASSGTGMRFDLGPSATVSITNNSISDTTEGLSGIMFDSISTPSSVELSNNFIQLSHNGGSLIAQGIVFSNVVVTTTGSQANSLTLSGTEGNTVQGAATGDTIFFVPSGTTTGTISVNGTTVP